MPPGDEELDDVDALFESLADEQEATGDAETPIAPPAEPRRPGYGRRTVLDEVQVTGDPRGRRGSSTMGAGGRVEFTGSKPPPDAPPDPDAEFEQLAAEQESSARDARRTRDIEHSPFWDALSSPVDPFGAGRRTGDRLSEFWTEATRDPGAFARGAYQGATMQLGDEVAGGAAGAQYPDERLRFGPEFSTGEMRTRGIEQARTSRDAARERSPYAYAGGELAGGLAGAVALPGLPPQAATARRIGAAALEGGVYGGVAGVGASDADSPSAAFAGGVEGAAGGVVGGAVLGTAGEALRGGAARMAPRRLMQRADEMQTVADRARLEASGVWGGRAMREADELPGGQERLARDLRRLQIGERGPGRADFSPEPPPRGLTIPRMDRAAEDAERVRRASGSSMESLAQSIDDGGTPVDHSVDRDRVERLARELDSIPIGGQQAAQRLRELATGLAQTPRSGSEGPARDLMTMRQAWQQRQMLDEMINGFQRDPQLSTLRGQLQAVRNQLSAEMSATAGRAGYGPQWQHASRDYQVGAFMRDSGRGADRLSVGGGIGGASAAGDLFADAMRSGSPLQVAAAVPRTMLARAGAQETRMMFPGLAARAREEAIPAIRTGAQLMAELAQRAPQSLGRYASQLLDAVQRGGSALTATHHVLAQRDPEYRRLVEEAERMQDPDAMSDFERSMSEEQP